MKILLVNPRGFCAGVRMAIDVVDQVLDVFEGETVYVYHEIVHNRHVVGRFRERGVVFVEDVEAVPPGAVVVFSAHGVSPAVRERARERGLHAIDATCPLVTKVHSEAVRYARQGYQILLVGHRDHQEIVGTSGEAPQATQVVETASDIPALEIRDPQRLVYLTQTTLSVDDAAAVIGALREAFPSIKSPPSEDICYATTNRQHAVRALAGECDVVLVVGSVNSSNSRRLVEIAEGEGVTAHLIDDAAGIDWGWFEEGTGHQAPGTGAEGGTRHQALGTRTETGGLGDAGSASRCSEPSAQCLVPGAFTVLVTAGASAPEDLVAGVCRALIGR
ncbi:MAG: 4-hydroxy-3-methylbut-2-enyl diphosphate reductase, partial [Myxococcaceae bacterium]|nr:4-hydroxy-3-methylbut-2-enyl diphosphate reductase [Myxococcaceae bacterium]